MAEPLLALRCVDKNFGGVRAVTELSFSVEPGQIIGLIGPNGSGKSTTVNLISGTLPPSGGDILIDGRSVARLPITARVPLGLARTFQTTTVFPEFSVLQQVLAACHCSFRSSPLGAVLRTPSARDEEIEQRQKARELLSFVGLGDVSEELTSAISSAQQRLLMIGTALASEPRLLLLDEPAAGMVAKERKELCDLILRIQGRGVAIVLIEHHMGLIMEVCERIVVLNFGEKIAEGTPDQIRENQAVIDAYLGGAN